MLPDIVGYKVSDGVEILKKYGINKDDIVIDQYTSPNIRGADIGSDNRVIKVKKVDGKIILIAGSF